MTNCKKLTKTNVIKSRIITMADIPSVILFTDTWLSQSVSILLSPPRREKLEKARAQQRRPNTAKNK